MREPRRDRYLPPTVGDDSGHVLDAAIASLGVLRGLGVDGDATAALHLLASLIAQAEARLPAAVADARGVCSWAQIGDLLGVTRASAWQRFAGHPAADAAPPDPDTAAATGAVPAKESPPDLG